MKRLFLTIIVAMLVATATNFLNAFQDSKGKKLDGDTLYKQNCSRCHMVPPFKFASFKDYSAGQIKTVILHMRVRANLTQEEAEAIYKFLTQ